MERYRRCDLDMEVEGKTYSKTILLVDTFMIFLNLSASYSIVPYLIFQSANRYVNILCITLLNVIYIVARFRNGLRIKKRSWHGGIFIWYVLLQISGMIAAVLTDTGWRSICSHFLLNTTFYIILYALYQQYILRYSYIRTFWLLSRGYVFLIILSLVGAILLFLLVKMGLNPDRNDITIRYDLFYDNYERFGVSYYYPWGLSIISSISDIRIPFFQEDGLITGLYHEPHCMTFMAFPVMFLLFYYCRRHRLLIMSLYLFLLLLEASTTNILAVAGCIMVYWLYVVKKNIGKAIVLGGLVALGCVCLFMKMDMSNFDFILNKIHSGSATYSLSTLEFAISPKTLWGTSFLNLDYLKTGSVDVGYLPCLFNALFLLGCLYRTVKLFKSESEFKLYLLLFVVYFLLHSTKVAMVTYSLTLLMFVVFVLEVVPGLPDNLLCREEDKHDIEK